MNVAAVDIFCGAGGLTRGLISAGISVRAGVDVDPACQYPYEVNNAAKFVHSKIERVTRTTLSPYFEGAEFKVLAGCAPCQPFSMYTQGQDTERDQKWGLLHSFLRLVRSVRPDVVTMENVTQLRKHKVFSDFSVGLENAGYVVKCYEINCVTIGIPQARKRLVLLASRFGEIEFADADEGRNDVCTVRSAIAHLPPLKAGASDAADPLHRASKLSKLNLRRMKASKPGGSWRDWDSDLVAKCHSRRNGQKYPSIYGRMEWDKPAPTITTEFYGFGSGRFGHPKQDRALSLREAALLQTFPPEYVFVRPGEKINMKSLGRLIGNAVPVRLGELIGNSIVTHLEAQNGA